MTHVSGAASWKTWRGVNKKPGDLLAASDHLVGTQGWAVGYLAKLEPDPVTQQAQPVEHDQHSAAFMADYT